MRLIGYSTGALACSDFRRGLSILSDFGVRAVELSALRIAEWEPLLSALSDLDLSSFDYISVHLPSSMTALEERVVIKSLERWRKNYNWPLILHPDAVTDWAAWKALESTLCLENMDIRKPIGSTEAELAGVFQRLPEAGLCFDIGHAWQVDPTMGEAYWILKNFKKKLVQVHVSEVNSRSKHDVLSYSTIESFRDVANMIPAEIPLILETPVPREKIGEEMNKARFALTPIKRDATLAS